MRLVSLEDSGLQRSYAVGGAHRTLLNSVTSQKNRILKISAVETSDLATFQWAGRSLLASIFEIFKRQD